MKRRPAGSRKRGSAVRSNRAGAVPGPTGERLRHAGRRYSVVAIEETDEGAGRVRRFSDQDPLERLCRRGVLSERQHRAGLRFVSDWSRAGILQRVVATYSDTPRSKPEFGAMPATVRQADARQRVRKARSAIGAYLDGIVVDILIDERDPLDTGRKHFGRRDGPQARASATDAFRIGLDMLADHYGFQDDLPADP